MEGEEGEEGEEGDGTYLTGYKQTRSTPPWKNHEEEEKGKEKDKMGEYKSFSVGE